MLSPPICEATPKRVVGKRATFQGVQCGSSCRVEFPLNVRSPPPDPVRAVFIPMRSILKPNFKVWPPRTLLRAVGNIELCARYVEDPSAAKAT